MKTRELGAVGERLARSYLTRKGLRLLAANYRSPLGEVDIIGRDRDTVVFIEVKARSTDRFGAPAEAVNHRKQEKLRRLAEHYLIEHHLEQSPVRFDVLSIVLADSGPQVDHIVGAF